MSATMMLAKVLDELEIGQSAAECLFDGVSPRRTLVARRGELRPVQGRLPKTPGGAHSFSFLVLSFEFF